MSVPGERYHELSRSIVADFQASVRSSDWTEAEPLRGRIVLTEERIVLAVDETNRAIGLSDVFDIVQGVSRRSEGESTETVTLAFRSGGARETVSISADATTMFNFQRLLYRELLAGTHIVTVHRSRVGEDGGGPQDCELDITGTRVRLRAEGTGETVTISRADVTRFNTRSTRPSTEEATPAVVLYSDSGDRVGKTTISMPSFRTLNLFGRYLRADLLPPDEVGPTSEAPESVEILLVDDDPHDLEMAEVFLKQQSDRFVLTSVSTASEGLRRLAGEAGAAGGFDCVVSDYQMPGVDGLEFLGAIRDRYPALPFILYTGQGSTEVMKQAILDDVTDYVEKDVGREQYEILAERIRRSVR